MAAQGDGIDAAAACRDFDFSEMARRKLVRDPWGFWEYYGALTAAQLAGLRVWGGDITSTSAHPYLRAAWPVAVRRYGAFFCSWDRGQQQRELQALGFSITSGPLSAQGRVAPSDASNDDARVRAQMEAFARLQAERDAALAAAEDARYSATACTEARAAFERARSALDGSNKRSNILSHGRAMIAPMRIMIERCTPIELAAVRLPTANRVQTLSSADSEFRDVWSRFMQARAPEAARAADSAPVSLSTQTAGQGLQVAPAPAASSSTWILLIALAVILAGGAWWWYRGRRAQR